MEVVSNRINGFCICRGNRKKRDADGKCSVGKRGKTGENGEEGGKYVKVRNSKDSKTQFLHCVRP